MFKMLLRKNMSKSLLARRFFFQHNSRLSVLSYESECGFLTNLGTSFMPINDDNGAYTSRSDTLEFLWHYLSISKVYCMLMLLHLLCIPSLLMSQLIKTMEQHLIVYCCHLGPQGRGFQMTFFFGVIKDTRRKSMLNALFSCLEKLCLNWSKFVAFAIDGATCMIGSY